ncbi:MULTISPECIES: WhiB family transcriptional regulator [Nocardiaceae]|uniref:WhiB family transcriptional regulator n=1 Tax=Nocardiaceae TaxID=85025 RepID=UPI0009B89839|nr:MULTISPECIES: WhiB family transcriptional regulator [Rhodococcus]OZD12550.1 WhiB family transcriptional regulator [Rhodococcus sp. 06-156-4a]OZD18041.1 WhiB family transcriptional regulator [Rhodococcus sp. 06-156-3C]OZD20397.1 WhiB family transcriptional regulator [Rhodococcus sp. 06-156-4C]OZD29243.1 WhiB family transcriptional regulator [Rhodococcus sp. 06-156-3]OZD30514.1 WhiB family transcriptional regulator [Rhodococcus sp. 06-156-3b]
MRNSFPPPRLPAPQSSEWEWQLDARCRTESISIFYPPHGVRGAALRRIENAAKLHCANCPVVDRCRSFALENFEPYGIWGGLTATERFGLISKPLDAQQPGIETASNRRRRMLTISTDLPPPGQRQLSKLPM